MLRRAIEAQAWSDALRLALACWRDTRDPIAARLVDRIAVRGEPVRPPEDHEQWIERATTYDPASITMLLDYLPMALMASKVKWDSIATRWPGTAVAAMVSQAERFDSSSNALDRLGAMERWPDDPRLAPVLATWLCGPARFVSRSLDERFRELLIGRLVGLRDVRVLPRLVAYRRAWPGDHAVGSLIEQLEQLERLAPPTDSTGLASLLAGLETPTELEALWERAAKDHPTRAVLADALVEVGDRRGTFITRQLAGDRADPLRRLEYPRWLGFDLTTIAVGDGSEFRDGMLETLQVGHPFTPAFAWTAVLDHRELRSVRILRTAIIRDAEGFGRFANALPALERLEILKPPPPALGLQPIVSVITRNLDIRIASTIPGASEVTTRCARLTLV